MLLINWDGYANQSKKVDKSKAFFVSLTYGEHYHEDWTNYKRDLQVFRKRLARFLHLKGVNFGAIWKLEFQDRGAPHYHLLLFLTQETSSQRLLRFIARSWVAVASETFSYDRQYVDLMERVHLGKLRSTGKCAIPVYSHENGGTARLMSYLMKYICKPYEVEYETGKAFDTGRVWGIWNDEHVPFDKPVLFRFTSQKHYERFVSSVRGYGRSINSAYLSN